MLKARVITALFLLTGLLAAIFLLPAWAWLIVVSLVCGLAAWEWGALFAFGSSARVGYALALGALCASAGFAFGLHLDAAQSRSLLPVYLPGAAFWLALVPFWLAHKWRVASVGRAALVGLVVLLPPALALAHLRLHGPWMLLAAMAPVWVADIAAYFVGRAVGRRKLAPTISPGKSWEGAWGAAAAVLVYGFVLFQLVAERSLHPSGIAALAVALVVLTAISIEGDLFESLLKRQAGLKDSGKLLPGHGGVLDRIDSLTSTLPFVGIALLLAGSA